MRFKMLMLCSALMTAWGSATANQPNVYGVSEKARLPELNLEVPAKLDTGAVTASLSAQNIKLFKRDGEDWVRFQLAVEGEQEGKELELPVVRISKIKRRSQDVEINLTDRTSFSYPFLIGSTALQQFDAMVDPSMEYSAGSPSCTS